MLNFFITQSCFFESTTPLPGPWNCPVNCWSFRNLSKMWEANGIKEVKQQLTELKLEDDRKAGVWSFGLGLYVISIPVFSSVGMKSTWMGCWAIPFLEVSNQRKGIVRKMFHHFPDSRGLFRTDTQRLLSSHPLHTLCFNKFQWFQGGTVMWCQRILQKFKLVSLHELDRIRFFCTMAPVPPISNPNLWR